MSDSINTDPAKRQYDRFDKSSGLGKFGLVLSDKLEQLSLFSYFLIAILLAFRFVLALFGANREALFVTLIYQITNPLMRPFEDMFGLTLVSQYMLEVEVLVALFVYALILYALLRLIRIVLK